jgi:hypothetical protein
VKHPALLRGHFYKTLGELGRSHPAAPSGLRRGRLSPFLPVLRTGLVAKATKKALLEERIRLTSTTFCYLIISIHLVYV